MDLFETTIVLVGMILLAGSLKPISTILAVVGKGRLHRLWCGLGTLIILFLVGYATFGALRFGKPTNTADLIVSAILLAGGGFVLIVARLSAVSVRTMVHIANLESQVVRDPLTGMFNRRYLDGKLEEESARARRSRRPLSVLLIDLDHFKRINDTYGHPIGDIVLKHVSDLIVFHSRAVDTAARYGGEEFVVIAPDSDLEVAKTLGERMLSIIAASSVALPDGRQLTVTASIGVATFDDDQCKGELLTQADRALYAAKLNGRNLVCAFVADKAQRTA